MAGLIALIPGGIGGALAAGGTILSAVGAVRQGNANNAAAQHTALQLEASAKTERAVAQRAALDERRQKELLLSRARAVGAASGGGQDLNLLGAIEEEGTLRQLTAMWQGEEAAKGRQAQAAASRFEGRQARSAGMWGAGSTLLAGGASFYDKFNPGTNI